MSRIYIYPDMRQALLQVAAALRSIRLERGYSTYDAAKLLGVHRPTLSLLERGLQRISLEFLIQACHVYQTTIPEIMAQARREKIC